MSDVPSGPRIITFYSYKGGTGRSMALANVAWILASNGKRVVVVDWDLEAPGLHRYFHPFLLDKELSTSDGLIDFILDFANDAVTPSEERPKDWWLPRANLLRYAASLNHEFPKSSGGRSGTIDFIPAGRQGPDYATRVNSFSWQHFYERLGGGVFLEAAKRSLADYDYVLIDSRTGVSDTSGICTIQMPDVLAVFFTMNEQSIVGAATAAESALAQRAKRDGQPGLRVFPVPSRIETAEKEKLEAAREAAQDRFDSLLWHIPEEARAQYWGRVEIPYLPFYAYEEVLATVADKPHQTNSLLAAMELITEQLTDGDVTSLPPLPEDRRAELMSRFTRKTKRVPKTVLRATDSRYWFYVSYARNDQDAYLEMFLKDLEAELRIITGHSEPLGFFDKASISIGEEWSPAIMAALVGSRVLVSMCSPSYFRSEHAGKEVSLFLQRVPQTASRPSPNILPIRWVREEMPRVFQENQHLSSEFPLVYRNEGLRYMMRLKRYQDEYRETVSQLAHSLARAGENPSPILGRIPFPDDLPNAFGETRQAGPSSVDFLFLTVPATRDPNQPSEPSARSGAEWAAFDGQAIASLATETAMAARLYSSILPVGDRLEEALLQARQDNKIVIVIADAQMLHGDRNGNLIARLDGVTAWNCGVIVVCDAEETRQLRENTDVTRLLPGVPIYYVDSAQNFRSVLEKLLHEIRLRIIQQGEPQNRIGESSALPKIREPFE